LKKLNKQIKGEFVNVNCTTLRGDQAMSVLFGHKKGSFTGAIAERPGLLKKADGGILFLDEIGELGLDEQAMLLRAIEEKSSFLWEQTVKAKAILNLFAEPTGIWSRKFVKDVSVPICWRG
jgi:sigma54-dependent transcription regulator